MDIKIICRYPAQIEKAMTGEADDSGIYQSVIVKNVIKYERINEDESKEHGEDYRKGLEKVN